MKVNVAMPPLVSIVVPTCNRCRLLARCLDGVPHAVRSPHEVIVVDGASTDGTAELLQSRPSIRVVRETRREGCARAVNRGFRAARGEFTLWLNDDAVPRPGAIDSALDFIRGPQNRDVGMVALYHNWNVERNWADRVIRKGVPYGIFHVRGTLYANFGLIPTQLLGALGYADESYFHSGWDPDLSLKVWHSGQRVAGCREALIWHDELQDERKLRDLPRARRDNQLLFEKWKLPPRNPARNDFDPLHPCTLRGLR